MRHGSHELPDGSTVTFADAEERHASKVWALQEAVLEEGRWFLRDADEVIDPLDAVSREIARHARDPGSLFLIGRRAGQVVAVLTLTRPSLRRLAHLVHLEIFVHADHRGAGLGEALCRCALEWARSNALLRKVSLSVYAHNTRARDLYLRLGFEEEGCRRGEVLADHGELLDDVLMGCFV